MFKIEPLLLPVKESQRRLLDYVIKMPQKRFSYDHCQWEKKAYGTIATKIDQFH